MTTQHHRAQTPRPQPAPTGATPIGAATTTVPATRTGNAGTSRAGDRRREICIYDVDLVGRAQAGDMQAFGELYQRHHARLTRYVAVRLRDTDPDAVADVVHDAFCAALADPQLIGDDVVGSLLQLAAGAVTCHDRTRRRYVRAAYAVYAQRRDPAPASPHHPVQLARVTFAQALARLSDAQRRVIQHRYLDGMSRAAVAEVIGRSISTVRDLERHALRRLHTDLTGHATTGADAPGAGDLSTIAPAASGC